MKTSVSHFPVPFRRILCEARQNHSASFGAFSVLELLIVIGIMAILAVMVVPSFSSTSRSTELGIAAQMVADEIHYCRSLAAGINRPVEICFQRDNKTIPGMFDRFRSRSLEQDGTTKWITQLRHLPATVAISGDPTLSNVLGYQTLETPSDGPEGVQEVALRFSPSGEMELVDSSVTLTEPTRFLTLAYLTDLKRSPSTRPDNFATIQISPRNSQAVVHRP